MKTPAMKSVSVGSMIWPYQSTSPLDPPAEFRGSYTWRDKAWQRHVSVSVDISYTSVSSAIDELTKASEGLIDPLLDIEEYMEYDSHRISTNVTGRRPATADEIIWIKKEIAAIEERRKQADQEEIESFRMRHPNLLKE